jgi:glycerophosphoryl diester phosphodiesterase
LQNALNDTEANMHSRLQAFGQNRPLVFGHRGAKAYAPMNTLPAFELAAAQGADGIELDVHRSKDGYPVIVHDFTVDETTDGRGRVTDLTLAELKALDAGGWFSEQFRGVRIPTLDEVFTAVGHRLLVNVEIKAETEDTDGVEQVVADCIARRTMSERVIVSSFNLPTLVRFRQIMPAVPIGFLHYLAITDEQRAFIQQHNLTYEALHPYHERVTADYVQQAGSRLINVWTVNEPERAVVMRELGVHGIITDQPDVILKALRG